MKDAVVIRRVALAELPIYKALRDDMLVTYPEAFTSDAASARAMRPDDYRHRLGLEREDGGHFLLGAWVGHALVGAIGCERERSVKIHHLGKVVGMMVRGDRQGRGIGRALLEATVGLARHTPGLEMLTLTVTAGNAAAVRLYERCGFERCGTVPRAIKLGTAYHDKHHMVLML